MADILVVDDELANRLVVLAVLREAGYTVHAASNGAGALAQLESAPCDLLVTDMAMPIMDGIELILKCRERHPGLPIVALSGGDWAGQLGRANNADFPLAHADFMDKVETVHKPFELDALLGAVARALGRAVAHPVAD
jgi:CheY-like chemotaxis protein